MKKAEIAERRRYVRAKRILSIEHRIYKRKGKMVDGRWHYSTTKNMSLAGVLFLSEIPYLVGDILEVRVVMLGLDVFRGFGRVVRVEEKKRGTAYGIAIVLVDAKSKIVKSRKS